MKKELKKAKKKVEKKLHDKHEKHLHEKPKAMEKTPMKKGKC